MSLSGTKPDASPDRKRRQWRPLVRGLHRDAGYLAVGFTVIYALSGLAVNHVQDWDPNFHSERVVRQLKKPVAADDAVAAREIAEELGLQAKIRSVRRFGPDQLDIDTDSGKINVDPTNGRVVMQTQRPRFLLRIANWLHLNRGKRAWTQLADLYALGLLFLAISGMFMLPGKNGMRGRGGLLVTIGIAIPTLYVLLSGGPK